MRSGVKMPQPIDQPWNEKISDLMKEARKADRVDKERAELFEGMMKTPAWKAYVELLELRLQLFADVVLQPSTSIDGSIALEYVKGAMGGIVMSRDLPSVTIALMSQINPSSDGDDEPEDANATPIP